MYSSMKGISFVKRVTSDGVIFSPSLNGFQFLKYSIGVKPKQAENLTKEPMPFSNLLQLRLEEAKRSVVIQINELQSWQPLYSYCSDLGNVNKLFHYKLASKHYILIEMQTKMDLETLLNSTGRKNNGVSGKGLFLYFEPVSIKTVNNNIVKNVENVLLNVPLKVNYDGFFKSAVEIQNSLDEKLTEFYNKSKIPDLSTRLRFLTCLQIQNLFSGLLPESFVYPFGSSVSGFGLNGCDLDLVIVQNPQEKKQSSLKFQSKKSDIPREIMKTHLLIYFEIMKHFMVGCSNLEYVLSARVPIIKFKQSFTGLDCDLSLYQTSGIKMAELLYSISLLHDCVKPLVFIIRVWARKVNLTSGMPGPYITNFSLTLLVVFFLQQYNKKEKPILPPVQKFLTKQNVLQNSDTLLNIKDFPAKSNTDVTTEELLKSFFLFYSSFDFSKNGCCVRTGEVVKKILGAPLYIVNPLDAELNVSKNVTAIEIKKFQYCCAAAHKILERNIEGNKNFVELFKISITNNDLKHSNLNLKLKLFNI